MATRTYAAKVVQNRPHTIRNRPLLSVNFTRIYT